MLFGKLWGDRCGYISEKDYEKSLVLDLYVHNYISRSNIIHRFYCIIIIVVLLSKIGYTEIKNYGVYKLVGQDWGLDRGNKVLKCFYRYDMLNKLVIYVYSYPCPSEFIDTIKK